jgi:predicted esterase
MARRSSAIEVEITEGAIRVRSQGRVLTITNAPRPPDLEENADLFIRLDEIEHWDPPDDEESIDVEELQRILDAIERQVERHGLSVVFD